jgi:hypothetical protein
MSSREWIGRNEQSRRWPVMYEQERKSGGRVR